MNILNEMKMVSVGFYGLFLEKHLPERMFELWSSWTVGKTWTSTSKVDVLDCSAQRNSILLSVGTFVQSLLACMDELFQRTNGKTEEAGKQISDGRDRKRNKWMFLNCLSVGFGVRAGKWNKVMDEVNLVRSASAWSSDVFAGVWAAALEPWIQSELDL